MDKEIIRQSLEKNKIDPKLRGLVAHLWSRGYETLYSCQGGGSGDFIVPSVFSFPYISLKDHDTEAYLALTEKTGDGWFERKANVLGLHKKPQNSCCVRVAAESSPSMTTCTQCGAGINGISIYRGNLRNTGGTLCYL